MTAAKLIARSLAFYWRTHLGVVLGSAVATAVLVGALAVGDSVRFTLRRTALLRLGDVQLALAGGDRFFRAEALAPRAPRAPGADANDLAADLAKELGAVAAPALMVDGSATTPDGKARANHVQVIGVDERFWRVGGGGKDLLAGAAPGEAVVNEPLAEQLGIRPGQAERDGLVLRVAAPSLLPREAPMSSDRDAVAAVSLTVRGIASDADSGRFSLQANQLAPKTVFVPLDYLQRRLGMKGQGNVLLVARPGLPGRPGEPGGEAGAARREPGRAVRPEEAAAALRRCWRLADAGLELRRLGGDILELRTRRVFLDRAAAEAALAADLPAGEAGPGAMPVLTYFANEIRRGERTAPYCIVSAMRPPAPSPPPLGQGPASSSSAGAGGLATGGPACPVPPDLDLPDRQAGPNAIVLNRWLADDIQAAVGDEVTLTYFRLAPMRKLVEESRTFRVARIIPVESPGADPDLLPEFPGVAGEKNCRDWKPGVPIDLKRIRKLDEDYWQRYRGTPKAFVSLAAGRRMWGNPFGDLTAVRYAAGRQAESRRAAIARAILQKLDPAEVGLRFQAVREQALAAARPTTDFGGLFLGLSFFLIVAAVLLMGLLFIFGVEQRTRQVGTLLALGFRPPWVRRVMLAEGAVLALAGAVVGTAAGLAYTRIILHALTTVWRGVSASSPIGFRAGLPTVCGGAAAGLVVALTAMYVALRVQGRAAARELLAGGAGAPRSAGAGRRGPRSSALRLRPEGLALAVGGACVLAAAGLLAFGSWGQPASAEAAAGTFFAAGALLLTAGLAFCRAVMSAAGRRAAGAAVASLSALALRTAARRPWRSLATIGLLACGIFLVAAVEVFRIDPNRDVRSRSSGTGGFALYGESAVPVLHDLNDPAFRRKLGLDPNLFAGVRIVQLRLLEGDDASCLNLNRAQRPRLLGVPPDALKGRFRFVGLQARGNPGNPWAVLRPPRAGLDEIDAVGDQSTITWALGMKLGQAIDYPDEQGVTMKLRLAGMPGNSILQGSLLVHEDAIRVLSPSAAGRRVFLVDVPADSAAAVQEALTAALADYGLELTAAASRLARFSQVQNTYLSIFAVLGGLGLVLGSLAMGIVVFRNVMERRGELALMRAVGFRRRRLRRLVLLEHWALLAMGLVCGVLAAVAAVAPALRTGGAEAPLLTWALTLAAVTAGGLLWTHLAARAALRGDLVPALRQE